MWRMINSSDDANEVGRGSPWIVNDMSTPTDTLEFSAE